MKQEQCSLKGGCMEKYLIIGAGAVGSRVARQVAVQGHRAVVVSRRGGGPSHANIETHAADAADTATLTRLAEGASAVFNCANPEYHKWPTDWPPIANALLAVSEASGATLVTLSNLYAYGQPQGPMTPHDPLNATYEKAQVRAKMWRDALSLHEQGRIRAVEVRASDFIGPGANAVLGERVIPRVLVGKKVSVLGDVTAPHSWTYVDDVATTLVACAQHESSWGRAWHAPTNAPRSAVEAVNDIADVAGVPHVKVGAVPKAVLRVGGIFSPLLRELPKTMYQFEVPFIIDDTETRDTLHLSPTPWNEVLADSIAAFR